jgi:hypothetical protein
MPFYKISQLTTATSASATDQFEINQGGASKSVQLSVLANFIRQLAAEIPIYVSVSGAALVVNGRVGVNTSTPAVQFAVSGTDAILIPVGTSAQRPAGAAGYLRFNSDTNSFEGYDGTAWGAIGGAGASGGGTDRIFWNNGQTVNSDYTIPDGFNSGSFGPITVASGITVTVPASSTWTVV